MKWLYFLAVITGTFFASVAVYTIPVLLVCSFAFNWIGSAKFFLCIGMFVQLIYTWGKIAEISEDIDF